MRAGRGARATAGVRRGGAGGGHRGVGGLGPDLVSALERHDHLALDATVRARVLAASAATLDRLLRPTAWPWRGSECVGGQCPPCSGTCACDVRGVGGHAPRRHGGRPGQPWGRLRGRQLRPHAHLDRRGLRMDRVRSVGRPRRGAGHGRTRAPAHSHAVPLRGVATDNGGEFMDATVAAYCQTHGIPCTRSRPYHKNDQAWVEQENGAIVRRLVGLSAPRKGWRAPPRYRGSICRVSPLRELLSAVVQAGIQAPCRGHGTQGLPRS